MSDEPEPMPAPPEGHTDLLRLVIHHIEHQLDKLFKAVRASEQAIRRMEKAVKATMTRADLDAGLDAVTATIASESAEVKTAIQALKDQINNGVPVTQADLDKLAGFVTQIGDINQPDPVPPQFGAKPKP